MVMKGLAGTVDSVLKVVGWLIVLVGAVYGAAALVLGFQAVEPWWIGDTVIDEEWMSVGLGFLAAAIIAVYTAFWWAVVQSIRVVVRYVNAKTPHVIPD